MKNKRASVAKLVALAVVPCGLMAVVARVGQQRRAEAATQQLWESAAKCCKAPLMPLEECLAQGADLNAGDEYGATALHHAVLASCPNIEVFLNLGANVNARTKTGRTPLLTAVGEGDVQTVHLLLRRGADVHAGRHGAYGTPLHWAQFHLNHLRRDPSATRSTWSGRHRSVQGIGQIIQLLKAAGAKE